MDEKTEVEIPEVEVEIPEEILEEFENAKGDD